MASEVVYRSNVRVERIKGPYRRAFLPMEDDPIYLATHSEVAEWYKHDVDSFPAHATTLDYVVAATAG